MTSPGNERLSDQAMVKDINDRPVAATWRRGRSDLKTHATPGAIKGLIELSLPHDCTLQGMLYIPDRSTDIEMVMSRLRVNPRVRNEGISKRLISALGHVAKQNQATIMLGQVESQYTVKALADVFGEDTLRYALHPGEPEVIALPMTTADAVSSLEIAETFERDLERREIGFGFIVDLSQVAKGALEQPART